MLHKHEGCEPCMYLDTRGNVTVGVGHLCATSSEAARLPFVLASVKPASVEQINFGWASLRYQSKPPKLTRYTNLFLLKENIDDLLEDDLDRFNGVMVDTFPDLNSFPMSAQTALWDMVFNLGCFGKFPKLVLAVNSKDWLTASRECLRVGISKQRNIDTQNLFEENAIAPDLQG